MQTAGEWALPLHPRDRARTPATRILFRGAASRAGKLRSEGIGSRVMKAAFEIQTAADGKYVFDLKSANDRVILTSQAYESRESAREGIVSVRQNAPIEERYEERSGADGRRYFVLIAANQQVLGRSQMYSTREALRKGIASVRKNGPIAEIVDLSLHVRSAAGEGFGSSL